MHISDDQHDILMQEISCPEFSAAPSQEHGVSSRRSDVRFVMHAFVNPVLFCQENIERESISSALALPKIQYLLYDS